MARFNVAFAMPVNDNEDPSSLLSIENLWKGCELLARSPETFTKAISSCAIRSDTGGRMIRTLYFSEGSISEMEQEVVLTKNHKFACTTLATTNQVTTMIFHGVSDNPYDLYLSIEYSIPYGAVQSEGPEGESFQVTYADRAKQNLVDGVATIRKLKMEGKLEA